MICPNLTSPHIKKQFDELIEALGEPLAYLVYHRNNGNFLDKDSKGNPSKVFEDILSKENDKIKALQIRAKSFSDNFSSRERVSKLKYDYNRAASEQSRAKRNNALIDISRGVLRNKNSFRDFITPGGYSTLSRYAKIVRLLSSGVRYKELNTLTDEELDKVFDEKYVQENMDFFRLDTQVNLQQRNMKGVGLKGMASNHNKNYTMRTWTNLKLVEPILFDGKELSNLNGQVGNTKGVDLTGQPISKNNAEFLAAILDHAKDPTVSFINYDALTADLYNMLLAVGYPLNTVIAFMNQPAIIEETNLLRELSISDKNVHIYEKLNEYRDNPIYNLDTEDLWDNISNNSIPTDVLLNNFYKYFTTATRDYALMIRAMRGDTQNGAASSTYSGNIKNLDTIKKALKSEKIKGLDEIFKFNEQGLLEQESKIPYLVAFVNEGIIKANKMLYEYFPNERENFSKVRETISKNMPGGRDLTEKEMEHINYSLITYLLSDLEFYKMNNNAFSKVFPEFVLELKNNPLVKDNEFIKAISYNRVGEKSPIPYLSFDNTKKYSSEQRKNITDGFYDLLVDNRVIEYKEYTYKISDIGKLFIKYSFNSSGYNFGPNSFFSSIPIEFHTEMEGTKITSYINKMLEGINFDSEIFIDQFYRNYPDKNYLRVVAKENGKIVDFYIEKFGNIKVLKFKENANRSRYLDNNKNPVSHIRMKNGDKYTVFQFNGTDYIERSKLGIPNILTEFKKDIDISEKLIKPVNHNIVRGSNFIVDNLLEEKYFKNGPTNIIDILGKISVSDHPLNKLAEKLLSYARQSEELGREIKVYLGTVGEIAEYSDIKEESNGIYNGNIIIAKDGRFKEGKSESVILHEIIHAFTVDFLKSDSSIVNDLRKIFEFAKLNNKFNQYGFDNINEFVAELFTNSSFIEELKTMPPINIQEYRNLFEEIIDIILKVLGLKRGDTLYEQASSVVSNIIDLGWKEFNNINLRQARALEIQNRAINPTTGKYYRLGYNRAKEKAIEINKILKNTPFKAEHTQQQIVDKNEVKTFWITHIVLKDKLEIERNESLDSIKESDIPQMLKDDSINDEQLQNDIDICL